MIKKKVTRLNIKNIAIVLVALYVVCHLMYSTASIVDLKMQQRQLTADLEAANAEQVELQAELEYMHTDEAMEKIAREKLGLVKNGEVLIRHIDTNETQ